MKKAIAAGVLLLAMLAFSMGNIRYLDALTGAMIEEVELSRARCIQGDMPGAEAHILNAAGIWTGAENYVGVFLRQSEEDSVEESLWALRECLHTEETEKAEVAYNRLEDRLRSMAAMEHVSPAAVF